MAGLTRNKGKILVVDDNAGIRSALKILLPLHFQEVELLASPKEMMSRIASFRPDAVLLDMNFNRDMNTGNEGLFWLSEIRSSYSTLPVVLFTAYADIALAVEGMKRGATDFIVKPWENERLISVLQNAIQGSKGSQKESGKGSMPERMRWGESPAMQRMKSLVEKIAGTDASVLITGENGTGKDLMATEIHELSGRRSGPMVCVDLGAVTETLFESELFGHVKGAFTDARSDHAGKFEQASGGTLFLDEIGNIPLHLQAKLLRVLQNRSVTRVGGTGSIPVDIRLVCATNMDLPQMVAEGRFREDLFYRINTTEIHLPPLRERQDEIIPLAERFMKEFASRYGRDVDSFSGSAMETMVSYRWNGNIRELRNAVEKAVIVSENRTIGIQDLALPEIPDTVAGVTAGKDTDTPEEDGQTLEMMEERLIRSAMKKYNGNLSMVAKSLDISRPTLYSKLRKYNI